jgi:hypothetical protein
MLGMSSSDFMAFCQKYGDVASVAGLSLSVMGLIISLVGFAMTLYGQRRIRLITEDAERRIARATEEGNQRTRQTVEKIAWQMLAADVESAIRYIGEVRAAGHGGLWHRAADKSQEARFCLMRLVGNPKLTSAEVEAVRPAIPNLAIVTRMIEQKKLRKNATPLLPEQSAGKLDEIVTTLGDILSRVSNAVLEA